MELGGEAEDAEAKARQHEINTQRRSADYGFDFYRSIILAFNGDGFSSSAIFLLFPIYAWHEHVRSTSLVLVADVRACHACAILCGLAILCRRLQSFAWRLVQYGRADRDGFIGCVCLFAGNHVSILIRGHVYFETSAMIITLIRIGKFLEARAKGTHIRCDQEADEFAR